MKTPSIFPISSIFLCFYLFLLIFTASPVCAQKPATLKRKTSKNKSKRLFANPKKNKRKKKQGTAQSLSFSGEVLSAPSAGQLNRKNSRMHKEARKELYTNRAERKKKRAQNPYQTLYFLGEKSTAMGKYSKKRKKSRGITVRVKTKKRPAVKNLSKKDRKKLPRLSKKTKNTLKYDKKERKIWSK